jgi:hypothetical protein
LGEKVWADPTIGVYWWGWEVCWWVVRVKVAGGVWDLAW